MKSTINRNTIIKVAEYIFIGLAVLISKSLYYASYGQNSLLLGFLGLLIIYAIFLVASTTVYIPKQGFIIYVAIIAAILVNPSFASNTFLVFFTILTSSLIFSYVVPYDRFAQGFYTFVKFLMIMSLVRYLVLFLNVPSVLPDFTSIIGRHYKNFIFFSIYNEEGIFLTKLRNNGLWWEPGAFQVIVNIAFIHGLIIRKIKNKDYVLFSAVILTTASTAGLIIFSILSIVFFSKKKRVKTIILLFIIVLIVFSTTDYYSQTIQSKATLDNISSKSRFNAASLAIKIFLDNPIIGSGFGNVDVRKQYMLSNEFGTGSNGFLLILANMGLLAMIIYKPLIFPIQFRRFSTINKILLSSSMIMIFFTQNFTLSVIFCLSIFYGVAPKKMLADYRTNNK
jgi:hypothetical protein